MNNPSVVHCSQYVPNTNNKVQGLSHPFFHFMWGEQFIGVASHCLLLWKVMKYFNLYPLGSPRHLKESHLHRLKKTFFKCLNENQRRFLRMTSSLCTCYENLNLEVLTHFYLQPTFWVWFFISSFYIHKNMSLKQQFFISIFSPWFCFLIFIFNSNILHKHKTCYVSKIQKLKNQIIFGNVNPNPKFLKPNPKLQKPKHSNSHKDCPKPKP